MDSVVKEYLGANLGAVEDECMRGLHRCSIGTYRTEILGGIFFSGDDFSKAFATNIRMQKYYKGRYSFKNRQFNFYFLSIIHNFKG